MALVLHTLSIQTLAVLECLTPFLAALERRIESMIVDKDFV